MKNKVLSVALLVLFSLPLFSLSINIRSYDHQGYTRVVLEGDTSFEYKMDADSQALEVTLKKRASVENAIQMVQGSKLVDRVVHNWEEEKSVFRVHMKSRFKVKRSFVLEQPFRVVMDLVQNTAPVAVQSDIVKLKAVPQQNQPNNEAPKANLKSEPPAPQNTVAEKPQEDPQPQVTPETQEGEQDVPDEQDLPKKKMPMIQTICIDPGHGGTDLGAVGRSKLMEKEVTLNLGKKLKRLIESKLGLNVIMTRSTDEEVSLNSRVSKANNQKAQLFVSVHVNSSFRRSARGPETYYVSLKATDQEAFRLSQKENSSFEEIEKIAENDNLKMILWNMAQTEHIKESSKLADFIQYELNILMHTRNRGVKQAPFRVLMRAAMPAVLVELAFLSNTGEEKELKDDAFLARAALAIYTGISKYIYYYNNMYR